MLKRKLGKTGIDIPPLCFGGNVFGWTLDETASFKMLDALTAADLNFIDTADVYSIWAPGHKGGESETITGNWLAKRKGKRADIIIATKVGMEMPYGKGLSKKHIMRAVEESLKRLQTDYIDLYQSHIDDETTPLEETLSAYGELIKQGKVRAVGASNYSGKRLAEALEQAKREKLPEYQCLQPLYNLYDRATFENELAPVCRKYGIVVINYYPLAAGFLTGKYRSEKDLGKSIRGQRNAGTYFNERLFRILDSLDRVAKDHGTTPAAVAIAWLLSRDVVTAPIASVTNEEQLDQLIAATTLKLDAKALEILDKASAPVAEAA